MAPPLVRDRSEGPIAFDNLVNFDFSNDEPLLIEVAKPKPPPPPPKELARRIVAASRFVPPKVDRMQVAFDPAAAPAGSAIFRQRHKAPKTAVISEEKPVLVSLTEAERGPAFLSTPAVPATQKDEEIRIADLDQRMIKAGCTEVVIGGPNGRVHAYRPKTKESVNLKAALARHGFVPMTVEGSGSGRIGRVYVQGDRADMIVAGIRNRQEHREPVMREAGVTYRVSADDSADARIARFDDLHPQGDRLDRDTANLFRTLERVGELRPPLVVRHTPTSRRPAEAEVARALKVEMNLSNAEAREKLQAMLEEHSDEGSFITNAGEQISFYIPKDDTAKKILRFFGYRKTHLSYPHLKEAYVLPRHLAAAKQTLVDHVNLLAQKKRIPGGVDGYLTSDQETVSILEILGYQRVLHDIDGDGNDEYVQMKPGDYAKIRKSDIPGTRRELITRPDGSTFTAYALTHRDGVDGIVDRFPGFQLVDIGPTMYFTSDPAALLAAKASGTPADKSFGK